MIGYVKCAIVCVKFMSDPAVFSCNVITEVGISIIIYFSSKEIFWLLTKYVYLKYSISKIQQSFHCCNSEYSMVCLKFMLNTSSQTSRLKCQIIESESRIVHILNACYSLCNNHGNVVSLNSSLCIPFSDEYIKVCFKSLLEQHFNDITSS